MRAVPGLCDRCSLRFDLSDLREEFLLGKRTGIRTCPSCYEESHPQLDTRGLKTNDRQSVPGPRSDIDELEASRALSGWNPVGAEATSTASAVLGIIRVVIKNDQI